MSEVEISQGIEHPQSLGLKHGLQSADDSFFRGSSQRLECSCKFSWLDELMRLVRCPDFPTRPKERGKQVGECTALRSIYLLFAATNYASQPIPR